MKEALHRRAQWGGAPGPPRMGIELSQSSRKETADTNTAKRPLHQLRCVGEGVARPPLAPGVALAAATPHVSWPPSSATVSGAPPVRKRPRAERSRAPSPVAARPA
jgi:hypothetical protein